VRCSVDHALVGRVHLCRPQKQPVERKRPVVACACHETSARHDRATIRRLEEAAGVEAQFEAIQSTETPLEFLLRKMRDTFQAAKAASCRASRRAGRHGMIRPAWNGGLCNATAAG